VKLLFQNGRGVAGMFWVRDSQPVSFVFRLAFLFAEQQKLKPPHTTKPCLGVRIRGDVVLAEGATNSIGVEAPKAAAQYTVVAGVRSMWIALPPK
jgi:hypothetical protein